jgi:hypothetical protein
MSNQLIKPPHSYLFLPTFIMNPIKQYTYKDSFPWDSASPSLIVIAQRGDVDYVMKIFPNILRGECLGLQYEGMIYKELNKLHSRNILHCEEYIQDVKYMDLLRFIGNGINTISNRMIQNTIVNLFQLIHYVKHNNQDYTIPRIEEQEIQYSTNKIKRIIRKYIAKQSYGVIVTKFVSKLSKKSYGFSGNTFCKMVYSKSLHSHIQLYKNIVFQILYTIYMFNVHTKITHNDLHITNIFVTNNQTYSPTKLICYTIGDKQIYKPDTPIIPIVYDFDRAYLNNIQNGLLTMDHTIDNGQTNEHHMLQDVVILLANLLTRKDRKLNTMLFKDIPNVITQLVWECYHNDCSIDVRKCKSLDDVYYLERILLSI